METNESRTINDGVCKQCGIRPIAEGSPTPLCESCRELYVKRPMPGYIKLFMLVIVAAIAYSAWQLPTIIKYNVAYQQAMQLEEEGKYVSAQHKYELALVRYPESKKIRYGLIKCYRMNQDLVKLVEQLEYMSGRSMSEGATFDDIQRIYTETENLYFPSPELDELETINLTNQDKITLYNEVMLNSPEDRDYCRFALAHVYLAEDNLDEAYKVLFGLKQIYPDNPIINKFIVEYYGAEHDFEKATKYAEDMLAINKECTATMMLLIRIKIVEGQYEEAINYIEQGYTIDDQAALKDFMGLEALVHHHTGNIVKRDTMVKKMQERPDFKAEDYQWLIDMFSSPVE